MEATHGDSGRVLWLKVSCISAYFLSMILIYQMAPFFKQYAQETCGATNAEVGLIFAALPGICFLGSFGVGWLLRRLGRRGTFCAVNLDPVTPPLYGHQRCSFLLVGRQFAVAKVRQRCQNISAGCQFAFGSMTN